MDLCGRMTLAVGIQIFVAPARGTHRFTSVVPGIIFHKAKCIVKAHFSADASFSSVVHVYSAHEFLYPTPVSVRHPRQPAVVGNIAWNGI